MKRPLFELVCVVAESLPAVFCVSRHVSLCWGWPDGHSDKGPSYILIASAWLSVSSKGFIYTLIDSCVIEDINSCFYSYFGRLHSNECTGLHSIPFYHSVLRLSLVIYATKTFVILFLSIQWFSISLYSCNLINEYNCRKSMCVLFNWQKINLQRTLKCWGRLKSPYGFAVGPDAIITDKKCIFDFMSLQTF